MEYVKVSEEYSGIAEKVIDEHEDLHWIRNLKVRIGYLASDREKKKDGGLVLGECIKVKPLYRPYVPHDFLIVIYETNTAGLTENQMEILMYHELLHIGIDEAGEELKYNINPHDVEDFRTVIDRYGIDWAKRGASKEKLSTGGENREKKQIQNACGSVPEGDRPDGSGRSN